MTLLHFLYKSATIGLALHPFGILHWSEGILLSNEHHPTSSGFDFVHTVSQDTLLTLYVKEAESSSS